MSLGLQTQALKETIIARLRADPNLAAVVGTRIYGEMSPDPVTWPFIRYGLPVDSPYRLSEWRAKDHTVTLHTFAKGRGSREINFLNALIEDLLDEQNPDMGDTVSAISLTLTSAQVILDTAETSAYHGILTFRAITAEATQV